MNRSWRRCERVLRAHTQPHVLLVPVIVVLQEQLAMILGLCTFVGIVSGRRVHLWCDNTGAEASLRRHARGLCIPTVLVNCLLVMLRLAGGQPKRMIMRVSRTVRRRGPLNTTFVFG